MYNLIYFHLQHTKETVAVKIQKPINLEDPAEWQREIKIFEILKRSPHDNIVRVLDVQKDTVSNKEVLIMEFCKGKSLRDLLKDSCPHGLSDSLFLLLLGHLGTIQF